MSKHLTTISYVGSLFNLDNFYSVGWDPAGLTFQGKFNKKLIQSILDFNPVVSRSQHILTLSLPEADFVFTV